MMILPGNGGRRGTIRKRASRGDAASSALGFSHFGVALSPARENRRQLVRRDDFELIEGALLRLLVEPPAAKLRCVAKTRPLHMVISDLDHQLRTKRFPSEILALAPAAQTARTALTALVVQGPILPRMTVD